MPDAPRILAVDAELVPLEHLQLHPRNPRQGHVGAISASIEQNGFYGVVVAQRSSGHILAGNHRYLAAQEQGLAEIPVMWVDVDDEAALRILLADNRTADAATYADNVLASVLSDLAATAAGLAGTAWSPTEVDDLLQRLGADVPKGGATDPDDAPAPPPRARSKKGDVWLLGRHRLVVGDSRDARNLDLAIAPAPAAVGGAVARHADALLTDPPYGVEYVGSGRAAAEGTERDAIENDDLSEPELEDLLRAVLGAARDRVRKGGAWWCFGPAGPTSAVFAVVHRELKVWRQTILWVKQHFVMGRQDYHGRHENLYAGEVPDEEQGGEPEVVHVGWKAGAAHRRPPDRRQDTVWEYPKPSRSKVHPTMKPVAMLERAIRNSTVAGDVVLDPFAGSGSTLIACHRAGRVAALVEKDPRYGDVICRRWQEHTGEAPVLESTGAPVDFLA